MSQEVFFPSAGLKCAGDLYLPEGAQAGANLPGIVIGHGFSFVKEGLVEQGKALAAAGFVTLAIDYRTFGRSEGEPRGQLFPLEEAEDYRNAISYLQARPEVDPDQIGIWGTSFAGGLVMYVGAVDRRVKAVVSQVPVVDGYQWQKLVASEGQFIELLKAVDEDRLRRHRGEASPRIPVSGLPGDLCGMPADADAARFLGATKEILPTWEDTITLESVEKVLEWSPISFVDRIAPRPLLVVGTSGYDVIHPAWFVDQGYQRAKEPKKIVYLPYGQMDLYIEPGLSESMRHATAFFLEHLGKPGNS
jgi:hypothetical protein